MLKDIGMMTLRGVCGGLLFGHGSQKLFGWFGGPGIDGTAGFMKSLGLQPSKAWAGLAGGSEFSAGLLTALGLFHPIGPIMTLGPMMTATRQVHWGKPIWATEGGAELPLTNMAIGVALATSDPGRMSLDHLLGIKLSRSVSIFTLAGVLAGVAATQRQTAQRGDEAQGEERATPA